MELASRRNLSVLLLVVVGLSAQRSGYAQDWARLAAYQAIKWPEGQTQPRVLLDGVWYDLLAIEGISTTRLIEHARSTYVELWQKRFEEDMVEILRALGRPHTGSVQLSLRDLVTKEILTRSSPMNAANRTELTRARAAGGR